MLPSDEWEDRDFNVADLMQTVEFIHEHVLEKISIADMKAKLAYDAR